MIGGQFAVLYIFLCSTVAITELCVPLQNCKDERIRHTWNESSVTGTSKSVESFRLRVWKRETAALHSVSNRIPVDCGHEYSGKLLV